jgi:toxin-antitoxin system PIN domain toxin
VTVLLDSNLLIGLLVDDHVHHGPAEAWFAQLSDKFATCPITQGSFVRLMVRKQQPAATARAVLEKAAAHDGHEFWPDDLSYTEVPMTGVVGHRQVTDAYLAQLARAHGGRLATFDLGLVKAHPDVALLVPTAKPPQVSLD